MRKNKPIDESTLELKLIEDLGLQYYTKNSKYRTRMGLFECPRCYKHFRTSVTSVRTKNTTSCGCPQGLNQKDFSIKIIKDLGMKFITKNSKQKSRVAIFECPKCKTHIERSVHEVKRGAVTDCGCTKRNVYGLSSHRLYSIWADMLYRCTQEESLNSDYHYYKGRGIGVEPLWEDIRVFIADMEPTFREGLLLDRIDNDKGYSRDNCRWATREVQSRNTRRIMSTNTSGYRGVSYSKVHKKYMSRIGVNGIRLFLGYYKEAIDGALAFDKYIIENGLEHTKNFNYNEEGKRMTLND